MDKSVGLTLSEEDYARLKRYADEHHWSMALAARIFVIERLDQAETRGDEKT